MNHSQHVGDDVTDNGHPLAELNVENIFRFYAELNSEDVVQPIAALNSDGSSVINHNKQTYLTKYDHPDVAFAVGDTVMANCIPVIVHVMREFKSRVCNLCCAFKDNLVQCDCEIVFHCDKVCKKLDLEKGHEVECRSSYFSGYCQEGDDSYLSNRRQFVFKIYSIMAKNPNFWKLGSLLNDGNIIYFWDMVPRPECSVRTEVRMQGARDMAARINANHPEYTIEPNDIVHYEFIISTYGFPLADDSFNGHFAWGLYFEPAASFTHSCTPNTRYCNDGLKLSFRAIGPILKDEQPTIGYIGTCNKITVRSDFLKRFHDLTCNCPLCEFEKCGVERVRYDFVSQVIELFDRLSQLPAIFEDWNFIYSSHKIILLTFRKLYHEYDSRITRQLCRNFNVVLKTRDAPQPRVAEILEETSDHIRKTFGKNHPYYARFEDVARTAFARRFNIPKMML